MGCAVSSHAQTKTSKDNIEAARRKYLVSQMTGGSDTESWDGDSASNCTGLIARVFILP